MSGGIWEREVEAYTAFLRAQGYAQDSISMRRRYARRLGLWAAGLEPWAVDELTRAKFVETQGPAAGTRRIARESVEHFYRWSVACGRGGREPRGVLPTIEPTRRGPIRLTVSTDWAEAVDAFVAHTIAQGFGSSATIARRRRYLRRFAVATGEPTPWLARSDERTAAVLDGLGWSPVERQRAEVTVRSFMRWGQLTGRMKGHAGQADASRTSGGAWAKAFDDYEHYMRASALSAGTIAQRMWWLRRLAAVVPSGPRAVTGDDLVTFVARPGWSREHRKAARSHLRGFFAWATATRRLRVDPSLVLPVVRLPTGIPRPAPKNAVRAALDSARPRDRVLILLALLAGLRRAEIARLRVSDVDEGSLYVVGKGGRARSVPLHPALSAELHRHIATLPVGFPWVFVGGPRRGHSGGPRGPLEPDAVGRILSRLLGPGWSAHSLRHAFASNAYAQDRDLLAVRDLLGHATVATTQRYTATPQDAQRAAVLGLTVPA